MPKKKSPEQIAYLEELKKDKAKNKKVEVTKPATIETTKAAAPAPKSEPVVEMPVITENVVTPPQQPVTPPIVESPVIVETPITAKTVKPEKTIPDDGMPDNPPVENYSPLEGQPIDMPHAKPNVKVSPDDMAKDIKEPVFTPPPFLEDTSPQLGGGGNGGGNKNNNTNSTTNNNSSGGSGGNNNPPPPTSTFTNPELKNASDKEKQEGAEFLVDSCLDAYALAHKALQWYLTLPKEKVAELTANGEIDLDEELAVDERGTTVTLGEFIAGYNEQVNEINVSADFISKVRPPMVRVFLKHGWGFTDEQFIMYMFAKDLAYKAGSAITFKRQINAVLDTVITTSKKRIEDQNTIKSQAEKIEAYEKMMADMESKRGEAKPETETKTEPKSKKKKVAEEDVTTVTPEEVPFEYVEPEEK